MPYNAQDLIALAIGALAAAFLLRRYRHAFASKTSAGCASGCGGCPAAKRGASPPIVTLAPAPPRPRRS